MSNGNPASTSSLFAAALSTGKTSTPTTDSGIGSDYPDTSSDQSMHLTDIIASQDKLTKPDSGNSQDSSADTETSPSQDSENSDSEDSNGSDQPKTSPDANVEFLSVTDHTGRKVKVKVDYSDKEGIKKAYNLAAGARKWQVERDQLRNELESYKGSATKKVENWDLIDNAFKEGGIEGLVNFLQGSSNSFDQLVDQRIQEREWRKNASPQDLALHEAKQNQVKKDQELARLQSEINEIKQGQVSAREEAELSQLRNSISPTFDKYRFAGKMNDPVKEQMFDELLWNNAMKQLEALPDDTDVTPELVNKTFRDYSNLIRGTINQQADKKAERVVAEKKRDATQSAQLKAQKSIAQAGASSGTESITDMLKQGRMADLFKMASKSKNFMK